MTFVLIVVDGGLGVIKMNTATGDAWRLTGDAWVLIKG